jgi:para-nitrobenzyl esterase
MTSPYAKGHFQKGIVQSGATETMGVSFATQEQSTALTQNILDRLDLNADNIENIQTISNADLQTAATEALAQTAEQFQIPQALGSGYAMEWGPVIDGDYMPTQPLINVIKPERRAGSGAGQIE